MLQQTVLFVHFEGDGLWYSDLAKISRDLVVCLNTSWYSLLFTSRLNHFRIVCLLRYTYR